ncbi:MAG TPA: RNA polymerase sigma factor, partial [Xanthomonadales bacterium]|nr:RNA polymerase sigma factor [Xanthomonadales bacterium]
QRVVYQIAYGVLGNESDAEDVSQDVFLRAYRKLGGLRDPEKFRAWVARMSRRLALNHQRAAGRAQRRVCSWLENSALPAASAEAEAAEHDLDARLRAEMQCLPEKLRSVLLLSAVDGLDTREVAGVLGIPQGTVRSRLHLARKHLLRSFSP